MTTAKKKGFIILGLLAIVIALFVAWFGERSATPNTQDTTLPKKTQTSLEELQQQTAGPTIIVSSADAHPGDEVEVAVTVVHNPGILGMTTMLSYDENAMQLLAAEKGDAFGDVLDMTTSKTLENGCVFLWDGVDITPEQIQDGEILHLLFRVADDAPVGRYAVTLLPETDGIYDRDLNLIGLSAESGYITVHE